MGDMIVEKLERPVGIGARCHSVVRSYDEIGQKCGRPLAYAPKCPGVIRSALDKNEWSECPSCLATGRSDDSGWARCPGAGWSFARRSSLNMGVRPTFFATA